jgi:hypothetical protein
MQDRVKALRIQPRHVWTNRGFNEFGDFAQDYVATELIKFCQDRQSFEDFLREDLERFGANAFDLFEMEESGWIKYVGKGFYEFDIDFLRRCYFAGKRARIQFWGK